MDIKVDFILLQCCVQVGVNAVCLNMEEGVGEGEFKSLKFMWMGLMWMPPTMWNHAADGFEH